MVWSSSTHLIASRVLPVGGPVVPVLLAFAWAGTKVVGLVNIAGVVHNAFVFGQAFRPIQCDQLSSICVVHPVCPTGPCS